MKSCAEIPYRYLGTVPACAVDRAVLAIWKGGSSALLAASRSSPSVVSAIASTRVVPPVLMLAFSRAVQNRFDKAGDPALEAVVLGIDDVDPGIGPVGQVVFGPVAVDPS